MDGVTKAPPAALRGSVESPKPKRGVAIPEIRPLTGIRAFAALWVVLLHFYPQWSLLLPGLNGGERLASRGQPGGARCFLLSGFILSYGLCCCIFIPNGRSCCLDSMGASDWPRAARQ